MGSTDLDHERNDQRDWYKDELLEKVVLPKAPVQGAMSEGTTVKR